MAIRSFYHLLFIFLRSLKWEMLEDFLNRRVRLCLDDKLCERTVSAAIQAVI